MTVDKPSKDTKKAAEGAPSQDEQPGWADGLRKLYDSVVDEPLPDSFKDLLAQLDDGKKGDAA